MSLLKKLTDDMKAAMKAKDTITLDTVRMALSNIKNKAIELGHELEDTEIVAVLKSDLKKLKDSLESFVSNARHDLADKVKKEIKVLEKYLPSQMNDTELEKRVREKIEELGGAASAQAGKVMGVLVKELREVADGSRIKALVDKIILKK